MSEDGESETSTIVTSTGTSTSSFTIPGPGALSGKAIKRFGAVVVKGVDAIIYRRWLAQIESILQEDSDAVTNLNLKVRERLYCDLFELSRSVYSVSIRTRAFRLIMRKIGEMDLEDMAAAVVNLPSKWHGVLRETLREILLCVRMFRETRLMPYVLDALRRDDSAKLMSYHLAGLNAYRHGIFNTYNHGIIGFAQDVDISRAEFCAPFLKLLVSLSTSPTISRALLRLEILEFITEISFQEAGPQYEDPGESLLQAILQKLDPIQDIHSISQIQELIDHRVAMKSTVRFKVVFKGEKEVELEPLEITQQLVQFEYVFQEDADAVTNLNLEVQKLYSDLLEWTRLGYSVSIRTRAFRLIMHKIGKRDSEDLAAVILHLPSSECQNLLWDMFFCIQIYKETRLVPDVLDALRNHESTELSLTSYYLAGLDAYGHEACQQEVDVLRAVFRTPFLISLRSMVSLSTSPTFSRVLLELEIHEFVLETSLQGVGSQYEDLGLSLLWAILEKLDPIQDIHSISQIQTSINCRA